MSERSVGPRKGYRQTHVYCLGIEEVLVAVDWAEVYFRALHCHDGSSCLKHPYCTTVKILRNHDQVPILGRFMGGGVGRI